MNIYLVGGAIRDKQLGLPIKDRDWVVTGATPQQLLSQGFKPTGKDFPVFLHPSTHEEYALARTEKKTGTGYAGFTFYTAPQVTLEQDLIRRDLTINAMAEDSTGTLIDPFNGSKDIKSRILRHVSDAFVEDPLRILRIARFAAQLHKLGFHIAQDTMALLKNMVACGEVNYLVPERIWQETHKAIMSESPDVYFSVLRQCNALQAIMPYWDMLFTQAPFVLKAIKHTAQDKKPSTIRFSCLGYPTSPNISPLKSFFQQQRIPKRLTEASLLLFTQFQSVIDVQEQPNATELVKLFELADAFRKPERFLDVLESSHYLRLALGDNPIHPRAFFSDCLSACLTIDTQSIIKQGITGKNIGLALRKLRIEHLENNNLRI